jgi:hypothetical protein
MDSNSKSTLKNGMETMPEMNNSEIIEHIIRSTIDVMSRRTSEGYAIVVVKSALEKLGGKFDFLKCVEIRTTQYAENEELVSIHPDINQVRLQELGIALHKLLETFTIALGDAADFYFIRELKQEIGFTYEPILREIGVDLDFMQFKYIMDRKENGGSRLENADVVKHVLGAIFDILDDETTQAAARTLMNDLIVRLRTKYYVLQEVKISDMRGIQDVDAVSVADDINTADSGVVGAALNKILIEVHKSLGEKGGQVFVDRFKSRLSEPYLLKLREMGVNLNVLLQLRHELVFKQVIKALIEVLSKASTSSYAVLTLDSILKKMGARYEFLKLIQIDSTRYSDGVDAVSIMTEIDKVTPLDAGRAIQKIIEELIKALGEEGGQYFVEEFKKHLGKTYLVRIEEIGVNLHMIELRQHLLW